MSSDPRFEEGLRLMLEAIGASQHDNDPPLSPQQMAHELRGFAAVRGRSQRLPYLGAGRGRGARVMMADGRWILDFAGPGNLFGHGNLDLIETAIRAAASDLINQAGDIVDREPYLLMKRLAEHAPQGMTRCALAASVGDAARMAFDLAMRRRQRRGLIALNGPFQGRVAAPVYQLLPFDADDPDSATMTLDHLREIIGRDGAGIAAIVAEPLDPDIGYRSVPREFLFPLFDECRAAGIAVWLDESRTFARTPQLFATILGGLADHADMITVGGAIGAAALLWRPYGKSDPVPENDGTIGTTVAMAVSRRIVEKLANEGYLGEAGRINQLGEMAKAGLRQIAEQRPGIVNTIDGAGALLSFRIGNGSIADSREFIARCFRAGLALDCTGREPARVFALLPAGDLTEAELAEALGIIEGSVS